MFFIKKIQETVKYPIFFLTIYFLKFISLQNKEVFRFLLWFLPFIETGICLNFWPALLQFNYQAQQFSFTVLALLDYKTVEKFFSTYMYAILLLFAFSLSHSNLGVLNLLIAETGKMLFEIVNSVNLASRMEKYAIQM